VTTRATLIALAATLALGAPARAAEVNTAMVQSGNDDAVTYVCLVVNLSGKEIAPLVELVDIAGATFQMEQLTLAPGATDGIADAGDESASGRCRVSGAFSRSKVAVSLALRENVGRSLVVVTAP